MGSLSFFTSSNLAMHPHYIYVFKNHSCTESRINSIKDTEGHARDITKSLAEEEAYFWG
jgi:hypothetical protein